MALSLWPKSQLKTNNMPSDEVSYTESSSKTPYMQSKFSISSLETSDLSLEHSRKQKPFGRNGLGSSKAGKVPRWRCTQWKLSRKHVSILLGINIVLMIGVVIWTSLLASFIHRIAAPPTNSNGILRIINSMASSTSSLSFLQLYQSFPADFTRGIRPISCHSHNDYWRHVPLLDAISVGCTSVEADIWASGHSSQTSNKSELYVGHHTGALTSERTLRQLYLNPLEYILDEVNRNNQNNNKSNQSTVQRVGVFDTSPNTTLVLLLDFKNSAPKTDIWNTVQEHLRPLREKKYLTYWNETSKKRVLGPVTVVGTGAAPFDMIRDPKSNSHRDIFFDAPLNKLNSTAAPLFTSANSYYASVTLSEAVGKVWFGLTRSQLITIEKQVKMAEEKGLLSRYWDTPAWPLNVRNGVWKQLIQKSVGVLNVDELWTVSTRDWRLCWGMGWGICA